MAGPCRSGGARIVARQVPVDGCLLMPRALAIWAGLSPLSQRARAAAGLSASMTVGRPPLRAWAIGPGCGEPGHGPLKDDVAIKLGERSHHGDIGNKGSRFRRRRAVVFQSVRFSSDWRGVSCQDCQQHNPQLPDNLRAPQRPASTSS